jgi:hypothetical protein
MAITLDSLFLGIYKLLKYLFQYAFPFFPLPHPVTLHPVTPHFFILSTYPIPKLLK